MVSGAAMAQPSWQTVRLDGSDITMEFPAAPKMERLRDAV